MLASWFGFFLLHLPLFCRRFHSFISIFFSYKYITYLSICCKYAFYNSNIISIIKSILLHFIQSFSDCVNLKTMWNTNKQQKHQQQWQMLTSTTKPSKHNTIKFYLIDMLFVLFWFVVDNQKHTGCVCVCVHRFKMLFTPKW